MKRRKWIGPCSILVLLLLLLLPDACCCAPALDYDEAVEKALNNSLDIRMSRLDIGISEASRRRAHSLKYPTIRAQWNSEYVHDLTDGAYQLTAVGDTVLVQNTMYQSSLVLSGQYNLYDFGATPRRVSIAERDVDVKKAAYKQMVRNVKLRVLSLYSDILTASRELEAKRELLALNKELLLTKERLYHAGKISKVDMVDEAVETVKILDDMEKLKLKVAVVALDLSLYTGEQYETGDVRVRDFQELKASEPAYFDVEKTPESKIYTLEIEKKQVELEALQRELYPRIAMYANYVWYANHDTQSDVSARYIKPRSFSIGIAATMTLFDGYKNKADIMKAKLEVERLTLEKLKRLSELSSRHAKLNETRLSYTASIRNQKDMLEQTATKLAMVERLSEQKLIEWTDFLNRKIELLNQKIELTKVIIESIATIKELEILSETGR
jgi:outer membrane protein TolC